MTKETPHALSNVSEPAKALLQFRVVAEASNQEEAHALEELFFKHCLPSAVQRLQIINNCVEFQICALDEESASDIVMDLTMILEKELKIVKVLPNINPDLSL